jgi:hypothetical protein
MDLASNKTYAREADIYGRVAKNRLMRYGAAAAAETVYNGAYG